ncbi:hypothetical protein CTI12_AA171890 [Artemisia annua]|uniref:Uncharacterized protein n=1 Tax=Artemisia annua TaxID=35608 RepID=A0A2U1PBJ2_ARTAN|nr:hypothetical protein CTI12_AA171890 [Artemisia annua]
MKTIHTSSAYRAISRRDSSRAKFVASDGKSIITRQKWWNVELVLMESCGMSLLKRFKVSKMLTALSITVWSECWPLWQFLPGSHHEVLMTVVSCLSFRSKVLLSRTSFYRIQPNSNYQATEPAIIYGSQFVLDTILVNTTSVRSFLYARFGLVDLQIDFVRAPFQIGHN